MSVNDDRLAYYANLLKTSLRSYSYDRRLDVEGFPRPEQPSIVLSITDLFYGASLEEVAELFTAFFRLIDNTVICARPPYLEKQIYGGEYDDPYCELNIVVPLYMSDQLYLDHVAREKKRRERENITKKRRAQIRLEKDRALYEKLKKKFEKGVAAA